jgi:hypothetical protein
VSDLATHWISPAWVNEPGEAVVPPEIAVVNPGSKPANLMVYLRNQDGSVHISVGTIVPPHSCAFLNTYDIQETRGWLSIASDQPVAPWGTTQSTVQPEQRVSMSFFRVEPWKISLPSPLL